MNRKLLIVANWKMNKTVPECVDFVQEFLPMVENLPGVDVVISPPFTALEAVSRALRGSLVGLAAQDVHWEESGAFTGEVSPVQLRDVGCHFVIVGHSERRQYFGESDGEVSRKAGAAIQEGMIPILCIGETLGEREYEKTFEVVERQLRGATEGLVLESGTELVVAYEPVWAIGTGKTATPQEAREIHGFIRGLSANLFGTEVASSMKILYGGSVNEENARTLLEMEEIDGALVGGASLAPQSFAAIVRAVKGEQGVENRK
jgi:triosephosphate isomerase